jgi:hypothetical protein
VIGLGLTNIIENQENQEANIEKLQPWRVKLKKISILKKFLTKFNKERQMKRFDIIWVIFKINEEFNRNKQIKIAEPHL